MMQKIFVWLGLFILGGCAGWLLTSTLSADESVEIHQVRQGGYDFINPLLECEVEHGLDSKVLKPFKKEIEKIVEEETSKDETNHVSVYYRDLNNGPWFGIAEDENFAPQSLLKVPLLFAYLTLAQSDRSILTKEVVYTDDGSYTGQTEKKLQDGATYRISELLEYMVAESDNDAFRLLVDQIDYSAVEKVHHDLGIPLPEETTPDNFISVKNYASLFRVLYNSSYLSREMSEEALAILSRATFNKGLVAGIPEHLVVAHKYGVRGDFLSEERQLHDCGIIYDDNPYLLCVMTRGKDLDYLSSVIAKISEKVYQELH